MTTISIQPKQLDLSLYAGDAFSIVFNFVVKLTGEPWPAVGEWNAHVIGIDGSTTEFTIDTSSADEGRLILSLSGEQTALITSAVWDLQQLPGPRTWYRGAISTTRDVTRV